MAILSATNVGQSFGAADIFSGVSVSIPHGAKVGLVGPNGIGKTTLLHILAGLSVPTTGTVHTARGASVAYLAQESANAFADESHTVYEEMLTVFDALRAQEAQLREMEGEMATGEFSDLLFERYSNAQERFELAGGYHYEVRIRQVLTGLGFPEETWSQPLAHLSGGQKTRVLLARLLLEQPDLLILDEPTNHLDVEAIEWLENTLNGWEGTVLLVSHDRYFLDRVVDTIWEMSRQGIEVYRGNYSAYVQQRQERWERRQQQFDAFRERMEKEIDYIRRNIAGQRTQMARGKLKRITRELKAFAAGGLNAVNGMQWSRVTQEEAAARIAALPPPPGRPPQLNFSLDARQRSGKIVLRTSDMCVGYPGAPLFEADDIELHRLECAALIGPNGSGKTTFLRTILGDLEPLSGRVELGASLQIGYFSQTHSRLDPQKTVIDELLDRDNMGLGAARSYLARYLFRGDDVFKPVGALSGGERSRLALALLALEDANFLLLDEPTNHLDIPAQEVLQTVLEQFEGTILLVSHDRYLVDRLATQVWELRDGHLDVFAGGYQALLAHRRGNEPLTEDSAQEAPESKAQQEETRPTPLSKNERRRLQQALAEVEDQIGETEYTLQQLASALQEASTAEHVDRIHSLTIEYAAAEERLTQLMGRWEELAYEQAVAE